MLMHGQPFHDGHGNWIEDGTRNEVHASRCNAAIDLSREVHLLLQAISECGERYGLSVPCQVLAGRSNQHLIHKKCYGAGRAHTSEWWVALGRQLCDASGGRLLQGTMTRFQAPKGNTFKGRGGFTYERISLTQAGRKILETSNKEAIMIVPSTELLKRSAYNRSNISNQGSSSTSTMIMTPPPHSLSSVNNPTTTCLTSSQKLELESRLRRLRGDIAMRSASNPYAVLSTADLTQLLTSLPTCIAELEGLSGWGVWKIKAYGKEFTTLIQSFLAEIVPESLATKNHYSGDEVHLGRRRLYCPSYSDDSRTPAADICTAMAPVVIDRIDEEELTMLDRQNKDPDLIRSRDSTEESSPISIISDIFEDDTDVSFSDVCDTSATASVASFSYLPCPSTHDQIHPTFSRVGITSIRLAMNYYYVFFLFDDV